MPTGVRIVVTDTAQNAVISERTFARLPVRVGRGPLNDLVVQNGYVSQFHLVIDQKDGQLAVRDLGSTNGTQFDGHRLAANELHAVPSGEFAIMALNFRIAPFEAPAAPLISTRKPMAVTGLLEAPNLELLAAIAQGTHRDLSELQPLYEAYRAAWSALERKLSEHAGHVPPPNRGAFYARVEHEYPAVSHEPDYKRVAPKTGSNATPGMTAEAVALAGIKELAGDFAPQHPTPETPDEIVQFLSKLGESLDVFFKCFIPLRSGYQQLARELGVAVDPQRTRQFDIAEGRMRVETATTATELSAALLNHRDRTAEAVRAVESIYADYMIHQVAFMNGVMNGVKSLLNELSPAAVEQLAKDPRKRRGLGIGPLRFKGLWDLYKEIHSDFASEERHVFSLLFGRKFAEAYGASRDLQERAPQPTQTVVGG